MASISYIIPSLNRETLHRTVKSIEMREGDEICVEYDIPRTYRWGNDQRNKAMGRAVGDYLAFIDDDDYYLTGYREEMEKAIAKHNGKLILFRMMYPDTKRVLWSTREVKPGNVSTPQILVPNDPKRLHYWEGARNMADCIFIKKWQGEIAWVDTVIVHLGHEDYGDVHHD